MEQSYHPLETKQTPHLSRGVNRSHSILRSEVQPPPGLVHKVLKDIKVALLGSQVHRGDCIFHLGIRTEKVPNDYQMEVGFVTIFVTITQKQIYGDIIKKLNAY